MKTVNTKVSLPRAVCHDQLTGDAEKRILIAGKGSYIGEKFAEYMSQYANYTIDKIDTLTGEWKISSFSDYDVVYDVAGIAHIKETADNQGLYFKVNRDLAYELAVKAKNEGVKQFIYLSSMSVYGLSMGEINENTPLLPDSAYGRSKLEAENLLMSLADKSFCVSIVRPPMVYGKNCKGNYNLLRKIALALPWFPEYENRRSMIFIDNLSSAVKGIIANHETGLYFPQDKEYVNTSFMVGEIAKTNNKRIYTGKILNPLIRWILPHHKTAQKAFGSLTYAKELNVPEEWLDETNGAATIRKSETVVCQKKKAENRTVSIVMPMYNASRYVEEAIISIQRQTYPEWELIVVNDCSKDNGGDIVQRLAEKDARIHLIQLEQNGGIAHARNVGMEVATGRYLAFLDSDDKWVDNKLERQLGIMDKDCVFVFSGCGIMSDSGEYLDKWRKVPDSVSYRQLLKGNVIPTSSVLIDMDYVNAFRMPERKHEDYATWLSVLRENHICAYGINEILEYYRKSETSVSRNKLRTLSWTWKIYHESEHFGIIKSTWCLFRFIVNTLIKYMR